MKSLNVLSIDWDYFIDADIETRMQLFPDTPSEKYSANLQNFIWSSRYSSEDKLLRVSVDESKLSILEKLLRDGRFNPFKIMVADSHRYCYDFVISNYNQYDISEVNIINVDFHHDMYENGEDVDCGNWLLKLSQEIPCNCIWVRREDSDDEIYHLDETNISLESTIDIHRIEEFNHDLVFICRSGMWSPPHLDKKFIVAFKDFLMKIDPCDCIVYAEHNIFESRYDENTIKELRKQKEQIMNMQNNILQ